MDHESWPIRDDYIILGCIILIDLIEIPAPQIIEVSMILQTVPTNTFVLNGSVLIVRHQKGLQPIVCNAHCACKNKTFELLRIRRSLDKNLLMAGKIM